jgi:predicted metalloendopeptidase
MLTARNADRIRAIVESAAAMPTLDRLSTTDRALQQKVGDYYVSVVDTAAIEAKRLAPLEPELGAIDRIANRRQLSAELGRTLRLDDGTNTQTEGVLGLWVHQGFDESDRYLPHLVQGGLGLGSADVYLDPKQADARSAYRAHIVHVLTLAHHPHSQAEADRILALEIAIARTHASRADTDDPFKTNNHWRRADFGRRAPGMDWGAYLAAAELGGQRDFLVWQPSAVSGISALVASQPVATWKAYLTFHLIDHYAAVLPAAFARPSEATIAPRTRALSATSNALGEAIGRLYVERFFPPSSKAAARAMAENLRAAFRTRITRLDWMGPETRSAALTKLAALDIGVGYPDRWTDYAPLRIVRGDAYGNMRRAEAFAYRRALAKLNRPVDPGEWTLLLPQGIGALINFSPNAIQFSAGILQAPYFFPGGDAAANYGSAGAGMAHEISHSFDLLGNLYDARGRVRNWWSADDLKRYHAAIAPLATQYSTYCPIAAQCLDGQRVLGEEAADLAGLRVAYDAYHLSLRGRGDRTIGGLTGDQRFFIAFAHRWQMLQTEEARKRQFATDIHAPWPYRSATVRNLDAWYAAFGVKADDRLYLSPEERVAIW